MRSHSAIRLFAPSKPYLIVFSIDLFFSKIQRHFFLNYITGYQASKDDLALCGVNEEGKGVKIESSAPFAEEVATPPVTDAKAPAAEEDDDDDVDLFGEETEEEKKAAEERAAAVKASSKKKESGKSSVLLDVKPWDDETDMQKLEEAVRSVKMEGLLWGASKLVPVGYGIKKLQIMMTIVDDLVSVDSVIEEHLTAEPANEYIQSCDIVAFNKICEYTSLNLSLKKMLVNTRVD
uniref:Translation elongation factor EF1B beta/delta subunit guanine nucleotide exchange domain-containing protein n=1 Tax=Ananas comosus var. bracteatus TaxID=296719 RepID=A0A6V7PN81_ANACO|nr:unnamed protein product [Ananas comosus var. bracteatus]